ncbi:MAG: flagellar hook basal-body protein [Phycisphaerae bacterium]|nr:flagellar hook basal-body protein [Phycisphaerae bacterium]
MRDARGSAAAAQGTRSLGRTRPIIAAIHFADRRASIACAGATPARTVSRHGPEGHGRRHASRRELGTPVAFGAADATVLSLRCCAHAVAASAPREPSPRLAPALEARRRRLDRRHRRAASGLRKRGGHAAPGGAGARNVLARREARRPVNYGTTLSAAGVLTSMHRLDVAANNLANAQTTAFKPDWVITSARLPERLMGTVPDASPKQLLEQLGGGVLQSPTISDQRQGSVRTTTRPLDVALDGAGFMIARDRSGALSLTRDGRLEIDANGRLVMASGGRAVLDSAGDEIELDRHRPITIFEDGTISQGAGIVAQIALVNSPAASLRKQGDGLYTTDALNRVSRRAGLPALPRADARLVQAAIEESAVDPVSQLVEVMKATRSFEVGTNLIRQQDQISRKSLETFGRFA